MPQKQKILDALQLLYKKEQQDKQIYKARAYAKVIAQIKSISSPIHGMEDLEGVEGIGEKIRAKIIEILETGKLEVAEKIKEERAIEVTDNLMQIYGVGPVKAKELVEKHNIRSFADLTKAIKEKPSLLNDKQKIGLKYVKDLQLRIPRTEMEQHNVLLKKEIRQAHHGFVYEMVGSYRRGAKDSGDIDVLMTLPSNVATEEGATSFRKLCDKLVNIGYITDVLALGDKKCMGVCRLNQDSPARRIDLLVTHQEEYPFAVLYFTGSDKFNIAMRKHALEQGYTMNEHGLKKVREDASDIPPMKDERDIFTFLKYPYVAPTEREIKKNLN